MVFRLGMTGQMLWSQPNRPVRRDKHTHVIIDFARGERLLFRDSRRFGEVYLTGRDTIENVLGMGAEPLRKRFTPDALRRIIDSPMKIKPLLMDQKRVAGIGNIYADAILFEAGIHPGAPAQSIRGSKIHKLHQSIRSILREAIACQGDTVSDYRTAFGESPLRANGLVIEETVLEVSARLIVNRVALKLHAERLRRLVEALRSVAEA